MATDSKKEASDAIDMILYLLKHALEANKTSDKEETQNLLSSAMNYAKDAKKANSKK